MSETKLYINNKGDDDKFAEMVVNEINDEIVLATRTNDKSFVCRLRGRTVDKFIFETRGGFTKTDPISSIISIRKYIPKELQPDRSKVI